MTVRQKDPVFEEIQWTGANLPTLQSFVEQFMGPSNSRTYTEREDGSLFVHQTFSTLGAELPANGWLIFGPIYGTDRSRAGWLGISAGEYAQQFEPA